VEKNLCFRIKEKMIMSNHMAKAILISFDDKYNGKLFKDIINTLDNYGIILQEYHGKDDELSVFDFNLTPENLCVQQETIHTDILFQHAIN
jgi:hypothetical protein